MSRFVYVEKQGDGSFRTLSNTFTNPYDDPIESFLEEVADDVTVCAYTDDSLPEEPSERTATVTAEVQRNMAGDLPRIGWELASYEGVGATTIDIRTRKQWNSNPNFPVSTWRLSVGDEIRIGAIAGDGAGETVVLTNSKAPTYHTLGASQKRLVFAGLQIPSGTLLSSWPSGTRVYLPMDAQEVTAVGTAPAEWGTEDQFRERMNNAFREHTNNLFSVSVMAVLETGSATIKKQFFTDTTPKRLFLMSSGIRHLWPSLDDTQKEALVTYFEEFDTGRTTLEANPNQGDEIKSWAASHVGDRINWNSWIDSRYMVIEDLDTISALSSLGAEITDLVSTSWKKYIVPVSSLNSDRPF